MQHVFDYETAKDTSMFSCRETHTQRNAQHVHATIVMELENATHLKPGKKQAMIPLSGCMLLVARHPLHYIRYEIIQ